MSAAGRIGPGTPARRALLALISTGAVRVLVCAAALLAGCAALAPPAPPPASRSTDPTEWSGRFSVLYTQPGAPLEEQNASGRFRIVQRDGQTTLELSNPIGQTIAHAQVDVHGARLTDSGGRHYRAPSAEALTEQLFGWRIPVLLLPGWLQGRFTTTGAAAGGRVWSGSDAGWSIQIDGWLDDRLVRTLQISWPAPGAAADRRLKLRLVVDSAS